MNNYIVCPKCGKVISNSKYKRHKELRCPKELRNHWHSNVSEPNEWQLNKESD